jgi:hypothetical protein
VVGLGRREAAFVLRAGQPDGVVGGDRGDGGEDEPDGSRAPLGRRVEWVGNAREDDEGVELEATVT